MPFTSKRQQRAAFGGHIPGFSKERALEWAHETPDLKDLPDRAPAEKGKLTLRAKRAFSDDDVKKVTRAAETGADRDNWSSDVTGTVETKKKKASTAARLGIVAKMLADQLKQPGTHKNVYDAARDEHERRKRSSEDFLTHCVKLSFAVPPPGKTFQKDTHVGSFSGKATTNFLKAPGPTTAAAVVNPRLGLRTAMTKAMRAV